MPPFVGQADKALGLQIALQAGAVFNRHGAGTHIVAMRFFRKIVEAGRHFDQFAGGKIMQAEVDGTAAVML